MAISRVTIAEGHGKVFGDTAPIVGLVSGKVRRITYTYKPPDQARVVYPQRVIELVYKPPGTPPDEAATLDFYRKASQTPWTIFFIHKVGGTEVKHAYNVNLLETTLLIEANDVTTLTSVFMMEEGELTKIQDASPPSA